MEKPLTSDRRSGRAERLVELRDAVDEVREVVADARFPLPLAGRADADDTAGSLLAQLDDYLVPRLGQLEAPVLAVVGGSTGAGKSTLVNSLVRAPVSRAGVLRPTTRAPLLLAHPGDLPWFVRPDRLPGLSRGTRPTPDVAPPEQTLQVVSAPLLRPGVALIDAPDLDSVVAANRSLARELFAAGDLWLFVTTAARYADATPWRALRDARDRGVGIAVVLNRVPPESVRPIAAHLTGMLAAEGLSEAPLFVLRESTLDGHGMLPDAEVDPVKRWLDGVAGDSQRRDQVTRRTLLGALAAIGPRMETLATAAEDQSAATTALAATVRSAYAGAMSDVEGSVRGGAVLRGDVYARWRELVASGELRVALSAVAGRWRPKSADNPTVFGRRFQAAVAAALAGLVTEADIQAALRCQQQWRGDPAGAAILAADPTLGRAWPGFGDAAHDLVHAWQTTLRRVAGPDAGARPGPLGGPSAAVGRAAVTAAATALLATVAAVAPPADEITGTGAHASALRAALRDPATRELGDRARDDFLYRVGELLSAEVDRHLAPVVAGASDTGLAFRLRAAAGRLRLARSAVTAPAPVGRVLGRIELGPEALTNQAAGDAA